MSFIAYIFLRRCDHIAINTVVNPSTGATVKSPSPTKLDGSGLDPSLDPLTTFGEPLQRTYSLASISTGRQGRSSLENSHVLPDSAHSADPTHAHAFPSLPELTPRAVGFAPITATISGILPASRAGTGFPHMATNLTNRSNRTNRSEQAHSVGLSRSINDEGVHSNPPLSPRENTSLQVRDVPFAINLS